MNDAVSEDTLLDGRVRLRQPVDGYRVAIDPVLLAASVPAGPGDRVLEIGVGTGAAALCLASRIEGCAITGLESDADLAALCRHNVEANGLGRIVDVIVGDLRAPPARLGPASFDHAMANPPWNSNGAGPPPRNRQRAKAHVEQGADLMHWVRFAATMLRRGGTLTTILTAERLDEHLGAYTAAGIGETVVVPLWSKSDGRPAQRVILRGRKDIRAPVSLLPGFVLHIKNGDYSPEIEHILRQGAALDFTWRRR
ncbi:MAG: methyltransferase [Alphaproteobacteria bacterium]|nr:methyltransferase [Alphaproteobacteria bacterium]